MVPVYGFAVMIDAVFANSVEFWTGENPVTADAGNDRRVVNAPGGEVVTMTRLAPGVMDVDMKAPDGTRTELTVVLEHDSVAAYGRDGTLLARVGDRNGIPSLARGWLGDTLSAFALDNFENGRRGTFARSPFYRARHSGRLTVS